MGNLRMPTDAIALGAALHDGLVRHDHPEDGTDTGPFDLSKFVILQAERDWAVETWAAGLLKVVAFSFPSALAASTSPGFVAPNPLTVVAFHLFLITAGTATSTLDLLVNGTSILQAPVTMASGVQWTRLVLTTRYRMVSVADVIAGRATLPDYLQAKITTAGATAADLYCGAEYQ